MHSFFARGSLVLIALLFSFPTLAERITVLDVPGSIPGTTSVFATDGGITVGTYQYPLSCTNIGNAFAEYAEYGFVFDGKNYQTFVHGFIGPSTTTFLPSDFPQGYGACQRVKILSFNKKGGIGYAVYHQNGQSVLPAPFLRSGIRDDFRTEIDLQTFMAPTYVRAPNGELAFLLQENDIWPYPTFINGRGQVAGVFYNGLSGGCGYWVITCIGQFLLEGNERYFNYTTQPSVVLEGNGIPPNERVIGFVAGGDNDRFRPVR
jgi:hypothetical protein